MSPSPAQKDAMKSKCKKCGFCCKNFMLGVNDNPDTQLFRGSVVDSVEKSLGFRIDANEVSIHIKGKCKNLGEDNLCRIHSKRPEYCKNFYCGRKR